MTQALHALDMRRLQTLHRVAGRASFSQAAQELHFTQSAVSQQVAALERDLGVRLLNRNPVSLTEPGRILCKRYETAVAELAAAEAELESFREGGSGRVRLAAVGAAASRIVPAAAAAFAARFPDVLVHVEQHEAGETLARLKRGEADIALTAAYEHRPENETLMRWIRLTRDRVCVAVPASHRLAGAAGIAISDLEGERLIHSSATGLALDSNRVFDKPPTAGLVLGGENPEAIHAMVAAGVGLALVSERDIGERPGVVRLPLVDPPLARSVYAVTLDTGRTRPAVAAMIDELVISARGSLLPVARRRAIRRAG